MNQIEDTKTIVLRSPIKQKDETIAEIHLREPTVREIDSFMKATEKHGPIAGIAWLMCNVSGLEKPTIDLMSVRDFKDCQNYLASFLEYGEDQNSQQTGAA